MTMNAIYLPKNHCMKPALPLHTLNIIAPPAGEIIHASMWAKFTYLEK